MTRKKKQNKKVAVGIAEKFLSLMEKQKRKFLYLFAVVIIANVVFLVVFKGVDSICGLISASEIYIESKIRNENVDHFVEVRKVISNVEKNLDYIEIELGWPTDDVWLDGEKRLDLLASLRRLDELSYELEWVANGYFTDYSIQYYPIETGNLSSYIYETRYLKKSIDRFVRVAEIAIALDSFDKRQIEVVQVELDEIGEYLKNIDQFEQRLRLFN